MGEEGRKSGLVYGLVRQAELQDQTPCLVKRVLDNDRPLQKNAVCGMGDGPEAVDGFQFSQIASI